jgi:hypothetical protein
MATLKEKWEKQTPYQKGIITVAGVGLIYGIYQTIELFKSINRKR